jgi:hypothetical protein
MSRFKKAALLVAIVVTLVACVFGVSVAAKFYIGGAEQRSATALCGNRRGTSHTITISGSQLSRADMSAQLCDELIIINNDAVQRRLAFGAHNHHVTYDGADGRLIGQGETLSLVLTKKGEFSFHDHFDEAVHGHFSVK